MDPIFVTYAAILTAAVVPIYIGSYRSLAPEQVESISTKDAAMFPIYGSAALLGLYVVFKLVAAHIINLLLTAYFVLLSALSVANCVRPASRHVSALLAGAVGIATAALYVWTKHWTLNNAIGLAFSITGIEYMNLGSFRVGCILLMGLFVYDVFWVFGTEVMVHVAKKFDAPVKLLFPRDVFAAKLEFAMLGLGDIVIPGVFLALMLRFDVAQHLKRVKDGHAAQAPTPYFKACLVAYSLGLSVTFGVMHLFKAAQPALLYLVPACLLSVTLVALVRGEFADLWAFESKVEGEGEEGATQDADLPFLEQVKKVFNEQILGHKPAQAAAATKKKE